jgi:hypothetical protein
LNVFAKAEAGGEGGKADLGKKLTVYALGDALNLTEKLIDNPVISMIKYSEK